jgi:hypothetical protein
LNLLKTAAKKEDRIDREIFRSFTEKEIMPVRQKMDLFKVLFSWREFGGRSI